VNRSHAAFEGSIPEIYHRHLGPLFFEPYAADLARRIAAAAPARGLEIACGSGIVTRHLAAVLSPGGVLQATDLNPGMLDVARRHCAAVTNVAWRTADACDLPFDAGAFDAVACQFGWMFFHDRPGAMREAHRVLAPGGRLWLSVWDSLDANPMGRITKEAVAGCFADDPPDFFDVPFGMHDVAALRAELTAAGFGGVEVETVRLTAEAPSAEHAAIGFVRGSPAFLQIQERGVTDPEAIVQAVARALRAAYGDRPLRFPMAAHVAMARR